MKEVCEEFLGDIEGFQKIADSFIAIFDAVSKVNSNIFETLSKTPHYVLPTHLPLSFNAYVSLDKVKTDLGLSRRVRAPAGP